MDIILSSLTGNLHASYFKNDNPKAPIAVVFHDIPENNGNMNEKVNYTIFYSLIKNGFSVIRFDFKGCGKSKGTFENGEQELIDASTVIDYIQSKHEEASEFWLAGVGFGAWVAMQILMRRIEITNYIAVSPYPKKYDYNFFSTPQCNGVIIGASNDEVIKEDNLKQLVSNLNKSKYGKVDYISIKNASHNYIGKLNELYNCITKYIKKNLKPINQ